MNYIGDLQTASNNEAPSRMRLNQWWYEQSILNNRIALLAGVHALDSEFAVSDVASLFLNGAFGAPPHISANVPSPVYPLAAPAVRLRVTPLEKLDISAAVYDGDPADGGENPHGVRYHFSHDQGLMGILEAAYRPAIFASREQALPTVFKFGSWIHTQDREDQFSLAGPDDSTRIVHHKDYGMYGILEQRLFREKKDEEQGVSIFFQYGGAPDDRNIVDYYFGTGITCEGLIQTRDHDILGIAVAISSLSERRRSARNRDIDAFDPAAGDLPGKLQPQETTLETTYRLHLHDRLFVQPSYEIIFNPSGENNVKTAHVFLLRFVIVY